MFRLCHVIPGDFARLLLIVVNFCLVLLYRELSRRFLFNLPTAYCFARKVHRWTFSVRDADFVSRFSSARRGIRERRTKEFVSWKLVLPFCHFLWDRTKTRQS